METCDYCNKIMGEEENKQPFEDIEVCPDCFIELCEKSVMEWNEVVELAEWRE